MLLLISALVSVTATMSNMKYLVFGVKIATKLLYVHFGVRYLCTMCKQLYFSCENVDIFDGANVASVVEVQRKVLWVG